MMTAMSEPCTRGGECVRLHVKHRPDGSSPVLPLLRAAAGSLNLDAALAASRNSWIDDVDDRHPRVDGEGESKLWNPSARDRRRRFVRKKLELNTESHHGGGGISKSPTILFLDRRRSHAEIFFRAAGNSQGLGALPFAFVRLFQGLAVRGSRQREHLFSVGTCRPRRRIAPKKCREIQGGGVGRVPREPCPRRRQR